MGLIKWIVAAALGAAVGAAIWMGIEYFLHKDFSWLAVAIGLTTGLAVRAVSAGQPGSYLRGGISVIFALGAIVLAPFALAEIVKAATAATNKPLAVVTNDVEFGEDDADAGEVVEEAPETMVELELPAGNPQAIPTVKDSFSWFDWLWFALAGLIAYELGRGTDKKEPVAEPPPEPSPEPEPPPAETPPGE